MTLEHLSAYLAGDLSPEASAEVEARLAAEPLLAEELAAMRILSDHLTTLDEVPPPAALNEAVLASTAAATGLGLGAWIAGAALLGALGLAGALRFGATPPVDESPTALPEVREEREAPAESRSEPPADPGQLVARSLALPASAAAECPPLAAHEAAAMEGSLDAAAVACLEAVRVGEEPEAARLASYLLLQDAWAGEEPDTWRALAVDHVSAIDPEDANLWAKLAVEASKLGDHEFAAATAADGLAVAGRWPEAVRDHHAATLHKVRVSALIALATPREELVPAIEAWDAHVREAGLDAGQVERVCAAYAADCGS